MPDGFIRLYQREWSSSRAERRVDAVAAAGLVLGHVRTGRITALDGTGEQVETDRPGLIAAMGALGSGQFAFQYWLDDVEEHDVVCTLTRLTDDVVVEDFSVDVVPPDRRNRLILGLLADLDALGPDAVGFVADDDYAYLETGVDEVVVGASGQLTRLPDLLLLRPGTASHPALAPYHGFLSYDRLHLLG